MLIVLIIFLISLLIFEYYYNNKELTSPEVLFLCPFILMCIIAQAFSRHWNFNLHLNTFLIVLAGSVFFCVGSAFGKKTKIFSKIIRNNDIHAERKVQAWKFVVLLILQLVCYISKIQRIIAVSGTNNLSQALVIYNNRMKFTTEETLHFPMWLSLGLEISTMFGFICACLLAQQFLLKEKEKKNFVLILLNFTVAVIGGSSSGGRGGSVQVLIAFFCALLILYQRKYNWKKPFSGRILFWIGTGLAGVVYLFFISLELLGRYSVHNVGRYLANYIGAQIFNFDYVLNNGFSYSSFWGKETFFPIIEKVGSIFGISKLANYHVGAVSITAAGYSTGNVFTCFYSYYKDFGVVGIFLLPTLFGFFSQIMYKLAKYSQNRYPINLGLVFYSMLSYMISFSFFADKFGSIVFSPNMLKRFLILCAVNYFMFGVRIKGTKIVYQKPKMIRKHINNLSSK